MSNTYRLENARGEVRRERSLTTFRESGDVYYDLDGFHFINGPVASRMPRNDWRLGEVPRATLPSDS